MPYKSQAQRRFMYAAEARGDVKKGTAGRWEQETTSTRLPEYVKEAQRRALGKLAGKAKGGSRGK